MDHRRGRRRARRLTRDLSNHAQTTLRLRPYGQSPCCPFSARCSSARRGPSVAQTIESVGIRAQGVAGAFVAVADDATATWWNPAGLRHSQSFIDGVVEAATMAGAGASPSDFLHSV